ncbi:hypothetical protein POM88_050123 [Heracleum sosnowskyi]|uniref:Uncharacterized protein n=1 Tax=Heracleum sosnowskyi TaxID=360622 RepID=A0AAD8M289_9APIA|nr:hypothetical protein POM88_050123 [Heracleum sosnowskyi]
MSLILTRRITVVINMKFDPRIVKSISQLCLQNWPTPAITWASTPIAHKDAVWAEFKKRYRWADEQGPVISDLFWQKGVAQTKDIFAKERKKPCTMLKLTIKATRWNTCTSIVPGGAALIYGLRCVSSGESKIGKRSAKLLLVTELEVVRTRGAVSPNCSIWLSRSLNLKGSHHDDRDDEFGGSS